MAKDFSASNTRIMMDIAGIFLEYWQTLVLVIGATWQGIREWKKSKHTSTEQLYEQLEIIKKKIIANVNEEIKVAEAMADKDLQIMRQNAIITELESHCKECYDQVMKRLNNEA